MQPFCFPPNLVAKSPDQNDPSDEEAKVILTEHLSQKAQ